MKKRERMRKRESIGEREDRESRISHKTGEGSATHTHFHSERPLMSQQLLPWTTASEVVADLKTQKAEPGSSDTEQREGGMC